LNEAESKFFESGGQDLAASISGDKPEEKTAKDGAAETDWTPVSTGVTKQEKERDGRFVPLQALQEGRAEKKQLREELKAYREWQAQLAQRLRQIPAAQPTQAPDPQTRPLEYINHVLSNMQASTAELQQWRKQQEQMIQQWAAAQQSADWAAAQEREFAREQPEYPADYRYAAEARDQELQALGFSDPGVRASILRNNTAEIIQNVIQQGRNPAELVWEYARSRAFAPKTARAAAGNAEAQAKIAAGLQAGGAKLNQGGAAGEGELSAKDPAGISDPEEFEKAWKRVFGKKR